MNKRTITDIKKEMKLLNQQVYGINQQIWKLEDEINVIKENKQLVCKHPHTRERTNNHYEEGRMAAPYYWEEKVCTKCGKVVAYTEETTEWIEIK